MSEVSLLQLLSSDLLSSATKKVFTERLETPVKNKPEFFGVDEFRVLVAVSDRLLPQLSNDHKIDLPGLLDTAMVNWKGNGWRYDNLPPDGICFKTGLHAIDSEASLRFGSGFDLLKAEQQDEILQDVQSGKVNWPSPQPVFFFEELLVTLTELYYSHPFGRTEMGDVSAADVSGWKL